MKSEQEKIQMCVLFLQKRGFAVGNPKMNLAQIAVFLGVSSLTVNRWINVNDKYYKSDFPKPLNFRSDTGKIQFSASEIHAWAYKHCEGVK